MSSPTAPSKPPTIPTAARVLGRASWDYSARKPPSVWTVAHRVIGRQR